MSDEIGDELVTLGYEPIAVDDVDISTQLSNVANPLIGKKKKSKLRPETLTLSQLLSAEKSPIFEVSVRQAEVLRLAGNEAYKGCRYSECLQLYERGLYHSNFDNVTMTFDLTDEHKTLVRNTIIPLKLNCIRVLIKLKNYKKSILYGKEIINEDVVTDDKFTAAASANVCNMRKTLQTVYFLVGKAYVLLHRYEEGEEMLRKSLSHIDNSIDAVSEGGKDMAIIDSLLLECKRGKATDECSIRKAWRGKLSDGTATTTTTATVNSAPITATPVVTKQALADNDRKSASLSKSKVVVTIVIAMCIFIYIYYDDLAKRLVLLIPSSSSSVSTSASDL